MPSVPTDSDGDTMATKVAIKGPVGMSCRPGPMDVGGSTQQERDQRT